MDTSPHVSPRALNHINSNHAAQAPQNVPAEYERLLADFPQSLHAVLRTSFPTILQLQSFRQDLAANDIPPGHETGVQLQLKVTICERQDQEGCSHTYSVPHQSLDQPDAHGATPLHAAILEFDEHLVRRLLDAGASPVHQACSKQIAHETRSVANLVESGALGKARLHVEQEQLEWAVSGGQASCPTGLANPHRHVNALFVDIAVTANERIGKLGVTMAAHAGANALTFAIECGAPITMVAMLVEHGKRHCKTLLAQADGKGDLPLVLAAACGRDDVVRLLLQPETGIDVDEQDERGHSALMAAGRNGNIALIGYLLEQCGALCGLTNNHGHNVLDLAILCGYCTAFTKLHDWGALHGTAHDRAWLNARVLEAFCTAAGNRDKQVMMGLYDKHKAQIGAHGVQQALFDALGVPGNASVLRWLIDHAGASFSPEDSTGRRPEAVAIDLETFEMVLDATYPSDTKQWPLPATRLLWLAARCGSVTYVRRALAAGADINAIDAESDSTALVEAVRHGDLLIVELLVKGGANIHNVETLGASALGCVSELGPRARMRALVWILVNHHPDLYKDVNLANMLLMLALVHDMPDLVKKLAQDRKLNPDCLNPRFGSLLEGIAKRNSYELLDVVLTPPAPVFAILNAAAGNAVVALRTTLSMKRLPQFQRILQACNLPGMEAGDYVDELLPSVFKFAVSLGDRIACELLLANSDRLPVTPQFLNEMLPMAIQVGSTAVFDAVLLRLAKVTREEAPYSSDERCRIFENAGRSIRSPSGAPESLVAWLEMAIDMGSARTCERFSPLLAELEPSVRKRLYERALLGPVPNLAIARVFDDPSYVRSAIFEPSAD